MNLIRSITDSMNTVYRMSRERVINTVSTVQKDNLLVEVRKI